MASRAAGHARLKAAAFAITAAKSSLTSTMSRIDRSCVNHEFGKSEKVGTDARIGKSAELSMRARPSLIKALQPTSTVPKGDRENVLNVRSSKLIAKNKF
jgi:hypothetical protein